MGNEREMRGKNSPYHFNTGNASNTLERAHSHGKEGAVKTRHMNFNNKKNNSDIQKLIII